MEKIGERINLLLSATGTKKVDFAERLGISTPSVSNFCSGKTKPSNQTISLICREFGVDEHWLRTGEGEMFRPKDKEEEVFSWVGSVLGKSDDDIRKKLLTAFASVPEDKWELLEEFVKSLQK